MSNKFCRQKIAKGKIATGVKLNVLELIDNPYFNDQNDIAQVPPQKTTPQNGQIYPFFCQQNLIPECSSFKKNKNIFQFQEMRNKIEPLKKVNLALR